MSEQSLMQSVMENAIFIAESLGIVLIMVLLAYGMEKHARKKNGPGERILSTRKIAMIGMFSAISAVLMLFEIPLPFAPGFYKLDFSELPALIGTFAFGPVAGVMIEFCKVVLKLIFKSTTTAFVGDLANFVVGCSFLLPASAVYLFHKNKRSALIGVCLGTVCMTIFGTIMNAVYLLPKFSQIYGLPLDAIIDMGAAINPAIDGIATFAIFTVAPFNLLKSGSVSLITMLIYKKISPIVKEGHKTAHRSEKEIQKI